MLSILISTIGSIIGFRFIDQTTLLIAQIRERKVLLQTIYSSVVILETLVLIENPHLLWIFQVLLLASIFWTPKVFLHFSKRKFKASFTQILDEIILSMHSGLNFRSALKLVIQNESGFVRVQMQEVFNQIVFQGSPGLSRDDFIDVVVQELRDVDSSASKTLDQLKFFRRQLRQEQEFHRKASQIKESVRAQMFILIFLYTILVLFVLSRFGFSENRSTILFSASLFLVGLILMHFLGGKRRWKV